MAIAFDVASSQHDGAGPTSLTWSHTVGAGSDLVLFVSVHFIQGTPSASVTSVTYAGAAMTLVPGSSNISGFNNAVVMYYKISPAAGANNVVVTLDQVVSYLGGGASSWTGVDQTTPYGTAAINSGTGSTASVVVSSATGEFVIASTTAQADSAAAVSTDQTEMWERYSVGQATVFSGARASGAASVTTNWTVVSPFGETWRTTGVSIKASGGAPAAAGLEEDGEWPWVTQNW